MIVIFYLSYSPRKKVKVTTLGDPNLVLKRSLVLDKTVKFESGSKNLLRPL